MPAKIFISYRRDDARDLAARLRDRLAARDAFGHANVFMDVDHLLAGQRFDEELEKALAGTDVFLAVIGPRWVELLAARAASGEHDYVRDEIAAALARRIPVIPVLVDRAPLPRAADLPEDIRDLVKHQKHDIVYESFGRDTDALIRDIKLVLKGPPKPRPPVPWKAIAALAAILALAGGGYYFAGTPSSKQGESIIPAPLNGNEDAKKRAEAEAAAATEDDKVFSKAKSLGTKAAFEAYLKSYTRHASEAAEILRALDDTAFKAASRANTAEAFQDYLDDWPEGQYVTRAKSRLAALKAEAEKIAAEEARRKKEAEDARRKQDEENRKRDPALAAAPGSGESFKDCPDCPEMVVVPEGSFLMGSPDSEAEHQRDESPQHRVTFAKPFAVGRFAVTFAEWDACVADGGCGGYKPSDSGWGRADRPVINVNWNGAKAYAAWLKKKTGKDYRLLSEAEREYVTRAGTNGPFWWGASINTDQANYDGNYTYAGGAKGEYRRNTLPVKSFKPNPWGLYQVHGNVREWVEDCYNDSYQSAPTDGSAWTSGACKNRVLRGGSWIELPQNLRAAYRFDYNFRSYFYGFRVARTVTP